jgi:hypothetical protein
VTNLPGRGHSRTSSNTTGARSARASEVRHAAERHGENPSGLALRPKNARLEPAVTSENSASVWDSHSKKSHT